MDAVQADFNIPLFVDLDSALIRTDATHQLQVKILGLPSRIGSSVAAAMLGRTFLNRFQHVLGYLTLEEANGRQVTLTAIPKDDGLVNPLNEKQASIEDNLKVSLNIGFSPPVSQSAPNAMRIHQLTKDSGEHHVFEQQSSFPMGVAIRDLVALMLVIYVSISCIAQIDPSQTFAWFVAPLILVWVYHALVWAIHRKIDDEPVVIVLCRKSSSPTRLLTCALVICAELIF